MHRVFGMQLAETITLDSEAYTLTYSVLFNARKSNQTIE
jgi:hypothetical protein